MRTLFVIAVSVWLAVAPAQGEEDEPARPALKAWVRQQTQEVLDSISDADDFEAAAKQADALFERVAAYAPTKADDVFLEAASTRRLLRQLRQAPAERRVALLQLLRDNPRLAHALAFIVRVPGELPGKNTPGDKVAEVYNLLDRFAQKFGGKVKLDDYANLIAAICVVHDVPLVRDINENAVRAADPLDLFEYFVRHERKMQLNVREAPAESLVYVVDSTASIEEMTWALGRYAGDREVGKRFFDIKYDYNHFYTGAPKKVTLEGYSLPNIKQWGGVCADQAYFASSVGKAIGVPTTYTWGVGGQMAHAWVGFMEIGRRGAVWNFDFGRYDAYKGARGNVIDPQTGQLIPDSYVSILAYRFTAAPLDCWTTASFIDAAMRLHRARKGGSPEVPPAIEEVDPASLLGTPRTADTAGELELIEAGLRRFSGDVTGWMLVRDMAGEGWMSVADKKKWADVLMKLCGQRFPDFTLDVLAPMVQTVENPREQNAIWEAMFTMFPRRPDLCAQVRMLQAQMWATAGDVSKAGRCYEDVISRFANAGPFVLDALEATERLLRNAGKERSIPVLYERTWSKLDKPRESAFGDQSNWYRVGARYAQALADAGEQRAADRVTELLEREIRPAGAR